MLKRVFFVMFVVAFAACGSKPRVNLEAEWIMLRPTAQHAVIAKDVMGLFESVSYKKVPLNDSISSLIHDNLVASLDEGRNYLMQEDIDSFEPYRTKLGSDFKNGDLSAVYHMYNLFMKRNVERLEYALTQVEVDHDFTIDEEYEYNRKDRHWFASEEEADEQWRQRVKYDLLNLKLSNTADTDSLEEKNKETIRSRYQNLISQTKKMDSNEAFQIIMGSLTDAIDPHTSYFNPYFAQQFNEGMANTFEGIGARLTMDNEVVRIAEVIVGGPVFREKSLSIDDRIIAVAQGEDGEFEDIIGWRLDNAVSKIKGPKGTVVRLKVIPAGQELSAEPRIVSITRERIVIEDESAQKSIEEIVAPDGQRYKVGIISIPKFYIDFDAYRKRDPNYKSTTRDVRLILDTLKQENVDAVLVDLRFNGGGSLQESIELTGLFIEQGPVVQVRDTRNRVEVHSDTDTDIAWDGPLGVLVNRFSASASEIFAGAIQDYGRGVILGTQTYGKGTVQSAIDMSRVISPTDRLLLKAKSDNANIPVGAPQFGQINITMAKFYRINGSSTQHKGVIPDIVFPSIYSSDKFGESSEPSALPWDQIKPTNFRSINDLGVINTQLETIHQERMQESPEYKFLLEDINIVKERESETSVTLQIDKLRNEREENRKRNRERIAESRAFRGLDTPSSDSSASDSYDFVKDESLKVMADYLALKSAG